MENVFIDNKLEQAWSLVKLRALVPDESLYSIMFVQPNGMLTANDEGVKNSDPISAAVKYQRFLELAAGKKADLVVTPEYSCPWSVVGEAVASVNSEEPLLPPEGSLWVLGCESITPRELDALATRCGGATWIYEKLAATATAKFLDPVCYLFWALDGGQQRRLVVLVQFKVQAMSDHSLYLERDHMIKGNARYVLRNEGRSIHLTTLICSDVLNFEVNSLRKDSDPPYIIVHPQLNTGPRHATFATYRKNVYQHKYSEIYELLCVNWSRGFTLSGLGTSDFGGSAFYTKGKELLLGDDAIEENHRKGLYYTFCESHHTSIYFFNYAEHVFYFQTTKPSQSDAMAPLPKRTGPEMINAYNWDESGRQWRGDCEPDDEFRELCDEAAAGVHRYLEQVPSSVNRERLLLLSSGDVGRGAGKTKKWDGAKSWALPQNLAPVRVKDDEVIYRITVGQDPAREARERKNGYLRKYAVLVKEILADPRNFPHPIADLAHDNVIMYPLRKEKYYHNLCRKDGRMAATVAYVGEHSPQHAKRLYGELFSNLHPNARRRLVVWFRDFGALGSHCWEGGKPRIDDTLDARQDIRRVR